ncbi:hypothetical protein CCACVL1_24788 [Corchorus capsularis]|uniref:Uncharacterized protein n=1 Tax=Corchorus capsularis TaxID=210143 RepID=A0A1R3GN55_COCAP|nr:hypothetical protein CCACVL1_24788 [Corchorus capsularis]
MANMSVMGKLQVSKGDWPTHQLENEEELTSRDSF